MNEKRNSDLTRLAQKLRNEMTRQERHLWYDFLKRLPVIIHRQKVIGSYTVDFYCASANLVIEIDGSQHYEPEGIAADTARDKYLNTLGLTVKCYTNIEFIKDFEDVCNDIYQFIYSEEK